MKNPRITLAATLGLGLLCCLLASAPARAADHDNLEEGLPTQVEDATPIPYGDIEVQAYTRYQNREKKGKDLDEWIVQPRVEWGIFPNTQLGVSVPFLLDDADENGSGDTHLDLLYNFNMEGKWLPTFAVAGEVVAPTGEENRGVDTGAKFIMSKYITRTGLDRVHVNAGWKHNDNAYAMERDNRFVGVVGYSRRINADTLFVTDYVHEQDREDEATADIVEVGLRRQLTPRLVLSAGAGAGLNDDSPDWTATLGFQFAIGRPARMPSGETITTTLAGEEPVRKP